MRYCDPKQLESYWFDWLISSSTPILEPYRELGLLWTKIVGTVDYDDGRSLLDPSHPRRWHYLNTGRGVYCQSYAGKLIQTYAFSVSGKRKRVSLPLDYSPTTQIRRMGVGRVDGDSLVNKGYIFDIPVDVSWHAMLGDIYQMCAGISKKFTLPTEEHREELAHDALMQVMKKLSDGKLAYTPGRASVFNLLTTTIHRCMFSTLNKHNKQQKNLQKVLDGVASGMIRQATGSLRCPIPQNARQKFPVPH